MMVPTYESTAREQEIIIKNQRKQIQELTNNWNELEEFIQKELDNNVDGIKSFGGYQCKIILDKMKEIKDSDKEC